VTLSVINGSINLWQLFKAKRNRDLEGEAAGSGLAPDLAENPFAEAHEPADEQPPVGSVSYRDRAHRLNPEPEARASGSVFLQDRGVRLFEVAEDRLSVGFGKEQIK
jgi:hypothetical protein